MISCHSLPVYHPLLAGDRSALNAASRRCASHPPLLPSPLPPLLRCAEAPFARPVEGSCGAVHLARLLCFLHAPSCGSLDRSAPPLLLGAPAPLSLDQLLR